MSDTDFFKFQNPLMALNNPEEELYLLEARTPMYDSYPPFLPLITLTAPWYRQVPRLGIILDYHLPDKLFRTH